MSDLRLGPVEVHNIKTSWSRTDQDDFFNRLYPNLFDQNRSLRQIFHNDELVIHEHSNIFADLFSFIIDNIEDGALLDEFLYQFVKENQRFAETAVKYLEPMGNTLITTFKQVLNTHWTSVLELVWIKVYVFVANSILQLVDDIPSETSSINEADIPPLNIQRNLSRTTSRDQSIVGVAAPGVESPVLMDSAPTPQTPSTPVMDFDVKPGKAKETSILNKHNSIEIDLKTNEKYKGFRRSVDVASSPIQVAIPTADTFQKVHHTNFSSSLKSFLPTPLEEDEGTFAAPRPAFDPRRRRGSSMSPSPSSPSTPRLSSIVNSSRFTNDEDDQAAESDVDDFATPRASRRGSFSENYQPSPSLLNKLKVKEQVYPEPQFDADDDVSSEDSIDDAPFDPRQRRRAGSDKKADEIPSPESSEVDEQEEEAFIYKQHKDVSNSIPERSLSRGGLTGGTFDYQSFGLKGLAPIVEDDDRSSKYDSDDEKMMNTRKSSSGSSCGESDSRASSLSLHHSDYKSSISSGVDSYNNVKGAGVHTRTASVESDDFQFFTPATNTKVHHQSQTSQAAQRGHKRESSMYSLSKSCSASAASITSTSRASLGFMRSSFVLKKEVEQQGYNYPENVGPISLPSTPRINNPPTMSNTLKSQQQSLYVHKARSASSLKMGSKNDSMQSFVSANDNSYDMINAFVTNLESGNQSTTTVNTKSIAPAKKTGFFGRVTSLFSSKSTNPTPKATPKSTPAPSRKQSVATLPKSVPYGDLANKPLPSVSAHSTMMAKTDSGYSTSTTGAPSTTRKSSSLFTPYSKPSVSASSTNLSSVASTSASLFAPQTNNSSHYNKHGASNHDLTSVYSNGTSGTRITMFRRKDHGEPKYVPPPTKHTRKGNKYNVKKVPYNVFA
ncbi:hypothetical protein FOB58_000375 [Candida parapsilosis]|uniref:Globin family profile domain-containing protein n=1 Tax=Candida parapsilosis TaxID=5480 RepID=A0A8X7NTP8_CANPA|nr:hypothetical protein FOB58_000375 [Candida parapsilosis]KAF6056523.1 hypothetical protein FOB59_001035 [Candida parapsilosis]KAF6059458.1 hypothetical protein FOB60_001040 [Candida parapsilosis]KAF6068211.1 hypothetical protein FOB61_001036 [Candida parapsilosis]KAI5905118.1 hypothetical protein K4G60_g4376 [Candida parapsilosis]